MPAAPARGGSASKPRLARAFPMRGSKSARTVSRPPARCVGRTQMWRSDIPTTTVTLSGPQRSLPRMGVSSLRVQEPKLMRSPGEPQQLNQRSFGCMIKLAVFDHCAAKGLIAPDRILGALAHPSPQGGSFRSRPGLPGKASLLRPRSPSGSPSPIAHHRQWALVWSPRPGPIPPSAPCSSKTGPARSDRGWGTVLPDDVRPRVVDSTADYRWMVLPVRPAGTVAGMRSASPRSYAKGI